MRDGAQRRITKMNGPNRPVPSTASSPAPAAPSCAHLAPAHEALTLSHFVARALGAELGVEAPPAARAEHLARLAAAPWTRARIEQEFDAAAGAQPLTVDELAAGLRRVRRRLLLALIARDVDGRATLAEVVGAMTALAEFAVQRALPVLAHELADVHGVPCNGERAPQDLLVVAMGKGGGGELNVSSDLDLIFVYDDEGETAPLPPHADARRPLSNQEFFERLGRRLIALLADVTADGFVFRVDMRLRPHGDAGPLVVSNAMLEEYLVRQGREWERFAWLKGRVVSTPVFAQPAGFEVQCRALEAIVRPFVFRKYLDFNAIAALRELHALIRAETTKKSARGAGGSRHHEDNVKLGRGGIREIEFIAQSFQIIRGGRDARLRSRSTQQTLTVLGELGVLPAETCARLQQSYEFLRRLEHALQYVDDAQTHLLPRDEPERERIAQLLRLPSAAALAQRYLETREFVAGVFDHVFLAPARADGHAQTPAAAETRPSDAAGWESHLATLGYADAKAAAALVTGLLGSRRVAAASESARKSIEQLVAHAVGDIARDAHSAQALGSAHAGADEVLKRFVQLLDVIAGRSTYVALLAQYPRAFARVLRLLGASRWGTDYLLRHPILLDELLDERLTELTNDSPVAWRDWRAQVAAQLAEAEADTERQMNVLRDAHHAQVFRLLLADLDGRLTVERLADHLSALADAAVGLALQAAWRSLAKRHRDMPRFAVIAYGKLGGKELGYASDLDFVFLYDDDDPDAPQIYARLAQRLVIWLTTQTSSGTLFDIDLRLRPDGDAGLMVSSFAAFERYQRNENGRGAWVWEHQALTRARFCTGDAEIGARFEDLRNAVLARPREVAPLAAEVLAMRKRMADGHPNRSKLFDLKHDRGGMVDIEFVVQFLVLAHSAREPRLLGNLGNIALLRIAGELGLIDREIAAAAGDAYRRYRRLQHFLRMNGAEFARVPREDVVREIDVVHRLWAAAFGTAPV
jgi:glutamate-ammonia-ligase adenylyltransferase